MSLLAKNNRGACALTISTINARFKRCELRNVLRCPRVPTFKYEVRQHETNKLPFVGYIAMFSFLLSFSSQDCAV